MTDHLKTIRAALDALLDRDKRNTCQHENTHRGGAIWEICDDCGAKWADDRGGKPNWEDPPEWDAAEESLTALDALEQVMREPVAPEVLLRLAREAGLGCFVSTTDRHELGNELLKFGALVATKAQQAQPSETDESIAADAYNIACEEMERWQYERKKAGKEVGTERSLCDGIAWLYQYVDELEAKQAQPTDTERAYLIGFADGKQAQAEAVPSGGLQRVRKALADRRFRDAPEVEDLLRMAANVIAEDGTIIERMQAKKQAEAVPQGMEVVGWEYRWFDSSPYTVTSGKWSEWERVVPRNPHMGSAADRVREIQRYIDNGMGKYEIRTLYAATGTKTASDQILCKDKLNNGGVCPHHNLHCGWPKCNEAAAPQQPKEQSNAVCRSDGKCQYAIDHDAEKLGHCPTGKCVMPRQAETALQPKGGV